MQTLTTTTVSYWLSSKDEIVDTSINWDVFSKANGGSEEVSAVIGKSIWDIVTDTKSRIWLKNIFKKVRETKKPVETEYRCDSPEQKRYMLMSVSVERGVLLAVKHRVLSTLEQPKRFDFFVSLSDDAVQRCSICNKIRYDNKWMEPEESPMEGRIAVSYTVCNKCMEHSYGVFV